MQKKKKSIIRSPVNFKDNFFMINLKFLKNRFAPSDHLFETNAIHKKHFYLAQTATIMAWCSFSRKKNSVHRAFLKKQQFVFGGAPSVCPFGGKRFRKQGPPNTKRSNVIIISWKKEFRKQQQKGGVDVF